MVKKRVKRMVIFGCIRGEEWKSISVQREYIRLLRIIQGVSPGIPDWISTFVHK